MNEAMKRSLDKKSQKNKEKQEQDWNSPVPGRKVPVVAQKPRKPKKLGPTNPVDKYRAERAVDKYNALYGWYQDMQTAGGYRTYEEQLEEYRKMMQNSRYASWAVKKPPTNASVSPWYFSPNKVLQQVIDGTEPPTEPEEFGCMWCGEGFLSEEVRDEHEAACGS